MNPWFLAGAMAMVISSYFYGHHEAYVEQVAEVQRYNSLNRKKKPKCNRLHSRRLNNSERQIKMLRLKLLISAATLLLASCGFQSPPAAYKAAKMPELPPEIQKQEPNLTQRLLNLLSPSRGTATMPSENLTPVSIYTTK